MTRRVLRGLVHGSTIELREGAGLADGEEVEVVVRRIIPKGTQPGAGFLRTEGALVNDSEWDAIMEQIRRSRK